MRQIKRIDRIATTAFQKLQQGALRWSGMSQEEFAPIEESRFPLIIQEADAIVCGIPSSGSIDIHYAFPNADLFRQHFSPMFDKLVDACRDEDAPFGYRFRLTERSSRAYVEPILTSLAFEISREWMSMELVSLPEGSTSDEIAPGFRLRNVAREDVPALIDLEERAFPNPQLSPEIIAQSIRTAAFYRVLEESSSGSLVGSLVGESRQVGVGHIAVVAIHPDYRRRGLGEALVRWALARSRSQGARRSTLTTNVDNAPAIALYRKLGFSPVEFGIDYRRPFDEEEVAQVMDKHRSQRITVRARWSRR